MSTIHAAGAPRTQQENGMPLEHAKYVKAGHSKGLQVYK